MVWSMILHDKDYFLAPNKKNVYIYHGECFSTPVTKNIFEIVQPSRCHGNELLQIDIYVTFASQCVIL